MKERRTAKEFKTDLPTDIIALLRGFDEFLLCFPKDGNDLRPALEAPGVLDSQRSVLVSIIIDTSFQRSRSLASRGSSPNHARFVTIFRNISNFSVPCRSLFIPFESFLKTSVI